MMWIVKIYENGKWKSGKYTWESYDYCPYCGAELEVDE